MKWHIETRKVSELIEDPDNPRVLTKKGLSDLKKSVDKFGLAEPIVINTNNMIIGGHGRTKVLDKYSMVEVYVPERELDAKEQKELNVRLNKNIAGEWDFDKLANLFEVEELLDWGFDEKELQIDTEIQEDEVPEVDETNPPVAQSGDVYQLGNHRLMCGDATKIEDVEKLMDGQKADMVLTDPPYGIDVVGDNGKVGAGNIAKNQVYSKVIGDDTTDTAKAHFEIIRELSNKQIIWGGNYFVDFLPFSPGWIIWDKRGDMTSNNFADGEMAWCSFPTRVRIYKQVWNGMIREGESGSRVHPTQKPVNTLANILKDHTERANTIIDCFGGSGSTLMACQQIDRSCYMMELDPKYCDVIVKRWEQFTGEKAIKL